MKLDRKSLLCLACFSALLSLTLLAQDTSDRAAVAVATKTIIPSEIRAHIRFLADSLLQGRAPGPPGYDIAARYVATELEGMGLHPAVSGGWFQTVPLQKALTDGAASSLTLIVNGKEQKLTDAKDYILSSWFANPAAKGASKAESDISAPVIFVGFGVTAPDQKYDDYAGVDVPGQDCRRILRGTVHVSLHRARLLLRWRREGEECSGAWSRRRRLDDDSRGLEALPVGMAGSASSGGGHAIGSTSMALPTTSSPNCVAMRCSASRERSCFSRERRRLSIRPCTTRAPASRRPLPCH